jgi:hypothetical protein
MKSLVLFTVSAALLGASWLGGHVAVTAGQEGSPRLSGLEIDVWPEFDRPSVLVILRAELAEDTALPADVALRIPTAAGRPAALAYATSDTGRLFNLGYEITDVQIDFTTLEFSTPDRFFHVEFYDALQTDTPDRNYSYVWLGDFAVDQLVAQVQEPAGATAISVQPELDASVVGPEGLAYREAALGGLEAGETLSISVQYTKTDSRTSVEILDLGGGQEPEPSDVESGSGWGVSTRLLVVVAVAAIVVGAAALAFFLRRGLLPAGAPPPRQTRAERRRRRDEGSGSSCTECGNRLRSGDRFCAACGSAAGDR